LDVGIGGGAVSFPFFSTEEQEVEKMQHIDIAVKNVRPGIVT